MHGWHINVDQFKPNDTSFEFTNMWILFIIDLHLATQFLKCIHEYGKLSFKYMYEWIEN
jgi:hypothetical protein